MGVTAKRPLDGVFRSFRVEGGVGGCVGPEREKAEEVLEEVGGGGVEGDGEQLFL